MGRTKKVKSFVMVDRLMLKSEAYKQLTNAERVLYVHLKARYNGANNGDISFPYSAMEGIMSRTTVSKALRGLERKGWIEQTEKGGLCGRPSRYRISGTYDPALW